MLLGSEVDANVHVRVDHLRGVPGPHALLRHEIGGSQRVGRVEQTVRGPDESGLEKLSALEAHQDVAVRRRTRLLVQVNVLVDAVTLEQRADEVPVRDN